MREGRGNLWNLVQPRDGLVITTNGDVNQRGRAVMGRGIALEAKTRYKGIDRILADNIQRHGNHAWSMARTSRGHGLEYGLIFMPVKHHWYEEADPELIVRSAHEVVALVDREQDMIRRAHALHDEYRDEPLDFERVWCPRFGSGNGKLNWADVRPLVEPIFDDRFIVVTF